MGPGKTSELLTVEEAALRTKRKEATWRRDILTRRIPYVKLGRSVRIPVEVVDAMIREGWREAVQTAGIANGRA
jgi:excisionase family DNA binding protein